MRDFIRSLPKAELHLHIEGSLEPEMLVALARRNGVEIPFASVAEVRAAYEFTQLQDFLDIYYRGMSVLREAEDFKALTLSYMDRAAANGI
ncbi:MAG: adenosine deaminase, partial [Alphaproteobacteria bacterium]|nr:adenosine deaminase [Alphaproteobacteria bacterium]